MARDMSDEERRAFLATGTRTAKAAVPRADGSPHVVPVGFSYDPDTGLVRIITFANSVKARNAARNGRAAVSQVDGGRWATLEGVSRLVDDPQSVALAVAGYAARYRQPGERVDRVAIEITVDKVMGRA